MFFILITLIIISSLDTFISGLVLGINDIRVKLKDILFINIIITLCLILAYFIKILSNFIINLNILKIITSLLFLLLSIKKIIDYFSKKEENNLLEIYKYANLIDIDNNKKLSISEIFILVISLSIDNILICISNNIIINNFLIFLTLHFIIGNIFFYIANRFSFHFTKINSNISDLISGFLFLILAVSNII